jgi:hypothetical protein
MYECPFPVSYNAHVCRLYIYEKNQARVIGAVNKKKRKEKRIIFRALDKGGMEEMALGASFLPDHVHPAKRYKTHWIY